MIREAIQARIGRDRQFGSGTLLDKECDKTRNERKQAKKDIGMTEEKGGEYVYMM